MSEKEDGGPAYPLAIAWDKAWTGMTLRDYFAGQALAGLLTGQKNDHPLPNEHSVAQCAYAYADAMLAARESGNE